MSRERVPEGVRMDVALGRRVARPDPQTAPDVGGADEWCVAGMTAPVRVNVGGRMAVGRWVLRGLFLICLSYTRGAFPPYSGEQSGTLLTTHAYVYTQDRPRS